jgi:hypothetical protein
MYLAGRGKIFREAQRKNFFERSEAAVAQIR